MIPKLPCLVACLLTFLGGSLTSAAQDLSAPIQVSDVAQLSAAIRRVEAMRKRGINAVSTIRLASATYPIDQPLSLSGEIVGDGLTIRAEKRGEAIFSAGKELESTTRDDQCRWRFAMPADWKTQIGVPRVILIDGRLRAAARWPKTGYLRIDSALYRHLAGVGLECIGNACGK